jgi:hypothetical protein
MDGEDLALLINNDGRIYEEYLKREAKNLARKMVKGEYNVTLAKKAWLNVVEAVLKDRKFKREVMREFELTEEQAAHIPIAIRREAAIDVMDHQNEMVQFMYKHMLPVVKKPRKQ